MKEFLTIDEVSEYLNLKKSTLYSLVGTGELPHYRIGRLIRFKRDDVETWMEGHRKEAIDTNKKARTVLKAITKPRMDIHTLVKKTIAETKGLKYTPHHGKPDQVDDLRKEVSGGNL